jgi:adenosine deaminase
MRDFFLKLPKTDIHCHLDGSLRTGTILELARQFKVKLPADNVADLKPYVEVAPTCRSLAEFLKVFDLIYPLMQHPESVERVSYELVEDCAAENIRHVEVRFAPELQVGPHFSSTEVIEATLRGLSRGLKDFGTTSSVIICLFRSHSLKQNRRAFETLKKFFRQEAGLERPCVVGLDLAGDEAAYPMGEYAGFFDEALTLGIPATCHAGETAGTSNLKEAFELGVRRIGHGTHLSEDAALVKEAARRKIALEVGLTSNVRTKAVLAGASHPALALYNAGVPITLNTDDRGVLGIDLTHEYVEAQKLGFSAAELAKMSLDSVDHLFLPPAERQKLKTRFAREIKALESYENPV